ncbi:hypothetical protein N7493_002008 [Penicillium malachiteum]|uniref:Uncharacterized protein n=1 Tax=Penicillium malachiteum TaxID=1324776 RepID=A0AAD6HVL3_9EURO|nr:hypothetical protein N7493_002008 [Penicillium malachiteum]
MTAQTAEPQSPTPSEDTDEQQFWNPWWNLHFHSRTHLFWQRRNGRPEAIELSALTRTNIDSPCYFFPDCQQHKGTQLCWCPDCRDGQNPRWCCCAHYAHYCIVSSRSRKQDLMVLQYPGCQNPALSSQYYVSRFTFPGLANNPAPAQVTPAEVTTAEASTARATTSRAITSRATTSRAITFRANTTRATTARATAEANNSRAPAGDTTTKTSKRKKTNKNKRKYNQRLMQMQQEQAMTSTAEPEPTLPAPSPELCAQPSGAAEVTSDPSSEDVVFSSSPLIPEPSSRLRRASWPLSLLSIEEVYPLT